MRRTNYSPFTKVKLKNVLTGLFVKALPFRLFITGMSSFIRNKLLCEAESL